MTQDALRVTGGPDKPALLWALLYPERGQDVHFRIDGDTIDAQIEEMSEQVDGWSFRLKGCLTSGRFKNVPFVGIYSVETRSGSLSI